MDDCSEELPEEDDLAFLAIERAERARLDGMPASEPDDWNALPPARFQYVNRVHKAAEVLGIEPLASMAVPKPDAIDFHDRYHDFRAEVDRTVIEIRLGRSPLRRRYSVELDTTAKEQIHAHIEQIRRVIDAADIAQDKKNALFKCVSALEEEVDRSRTRFANMMANIIVLADTGEYVAKKAAPWARFIDRILEVLGWAKADEDRRGLPKPQEKPRLEPPKKKSEAFELDDEIPF